MTAPFDPSKPVQTRDGRAARIVCTDRKNESNYSILALVQDHIYPDFETASTYYADGRESATHERKGDLVNIDEFALPGRDIVLTRNGKRVWLYTRNGGHIDYPFVGTMENDRGMVAMWRKDGSYTTRTNGLDLML